MKKINNLSHRELATISGGSATSIGAAIGGVAGTAYCYAIISELGFGDGYGISSVGAAIYGVCGTAGALAGAAIGGVWSCIFKSANTMNSIGTKRDELPALPTFPAMPTLPDFPII